MILANTSFRYISSLQAKVRNAMIASQTSLTFQYDDEPFFLNYEALRKVWVNGVSQRQVVAELNIGRASLKEWESNFIQYGTIGILTPVACIEVDLKLEQLVQIVRAARPHTVSKNILTLAKALKIPATLELIHSIQRSYGYGQRMDEKDEQFFTEFQRIFHSIHYQKNAHIPQKRDRKDRINTFLNYDHDAFQHRVELFRQLSQIKKKQQVRQTLRQYGIQSSRFYALKERYLSFGIWGLIELIHTSRRKGEKISPELELTIIEKRLMNPALSTRKMIKELNLQCSRGNVQRIYSRWDLASFKQAVPFRGIISLQEPSVVNPSILKPSARQQFPKLIEKNNLKVDRHFQKFIHTLSYRHVSISNPGAIIVAPFLDQLGLIEAIYSHGPTTLRTTDISNDIIVNVLRIITGFPTINSYMLNSDRSVAIGSGLLQHPKKSSFYRSMDEFEFIHLEALRNDLAIRARELHVIEGKEISIDYHCDPSDSKYPLDQGLTKAPDKNGNVVYAHRPQLIWDSITNSIINIAYCEGRSRAPSALYNFLEKNLFEIIDSAAIEEIFADSEYTGEKQLIYLLVHTAASVTMCLKQNAKIKRWKEETIKEGKWQKYGSQYQIVYRDYTLAETGHLFRFVVKQNIESNETRCFGSTHIDLSPEQILDRYHIRWPVETGIKDLIENYFLNKPIGSSPEKVEVHYYCIMAARLLIDYFKQVVLEPKWKLTEDSQSVLSTIRLTLFSSQSCILSLAENGDLQLTYQDGDPLGIKKHLQEKLQVRTKAGLNKVSWWGNRGLQIKIEDQYLTNNGTEIG